MSQNSFFVKKTYELTDTEWCQIIELFKKVFNRDTSIENFKRTYSNTPLGYSYHSIMTSDDIIVGLNSFIPVYFNYCGKKTLFADSVTTMVEIHHRGITNFYKIVSEGYKILEADGIKFVYAYPNDNSYPVFTKMKLQLPIGRMNTYCLPYRIGGINKKLAFFNFLSKALCNTFLWVSDLFASKNIPEYIIEKDVESYNIYRYSRADYYHIVNKNGIEFMYAIKIHEGVKTAFLIDVSKKSAKNFIFAIKHIIRNHKRDFDLLLYPGIIPFKINGLIKIPRKLEPKNFNFTGIALDKNYFDKSIYKIENWDTNLSNYDLI